jgi:hypothetical protein
MKGATVMALLFSHNRVQQGGPESQGMTRRRRRGAERAQARRQRGRETGIAWATQRRSKGRMQTMAAATRTTPRSSLPRPHARAPRASPSRERERPLCEGALARSPWRSWPCLRSFPQNLSAVKCRAVARRRKVSVKASSTKNVVRCKSLYRIICMHAHGKDASHTLPSSPAPAIRMEIEGLRAGIAYIAETSSPASVIKLVCRAAPRTAGARGSACCVSAITASISA